MSKYHVETAAPIRRAVLQNHRELLPLVSIVALWSLTYDILKLHVEVTNELLRFKLEELDVILLSKKEEIVVDSFLDNLSELDSIAKFLKQGATTLSEVYALLDGVMEQYLMTRELLSKSTTIVENPKVEVTVIMLPRQTVNELDIEEVNLVQYSRLKRDFTNRRDSFISFVEKALNHNTLSMLRSNDFIDTCIIVQTKSAVHQLFSACPYLRTDYKNGAFQNEFGNADISTCEHRPAGNIWCERSIYQKFGIYASCSQLARLK